jgi:hypothetical protein
MPLTDGRVRQHWEISKDEGRNWSTIWKPLIKVYLPHSPVGMPHHLL